MPNENIPVGSKRQRDTALCNFLSRVEAIKLEFNSNKRKSYQIADSDDESALNTHYSQKIATVTASKPIFGELTNLPATEALFKQGYRAPNVD